MNFAERESDQLFLHQEKKNNHFVKLKDGSTKKSAMWTSRLKLVLADRVSTINCEYD